MPEYKNCIIKNIHRGKKEDGRDIYIYASLYSESGQLLISATLDYIVEMLENRLPEEK